MTFADHRLTFGLVLALLGLFGAGCSGASGSTLEQQIESANGSASGADAGDVDAERGSNQAGDSDQEAGDDADAVAIRPVVEIPAEWDSAIEAVYGRYWLYWEAFAAAHGPPHADPDYGPLRELSTDKNWSSLQRQLQAFADDGLLLALPEPSATEHMIRIPNTSVLTQEEGAEVILQDCWIDDFVQQTVDGVVVDEGKEAKLMNVVMTVVDGEWRVDGVSRATIESDGYEQCETLVS
jgi:hypothetical protein